MAGAQLTEKDIFTKHYASLCNTLTDINNLLPYFVQERIISISDEAEINEGKTMLEKAQKLLVCIFGPLKAGDATGFHKMLTIMKEHGSQSTKDLAVKINSEITSSRKPEGHTVKSTDVIPARGCDRPALKLLNKHVRPYIFSKWHDLGLELLEQEDEEELNLISASYPNNMNLCCREMFQLWLRKCATATWDQLIQALREVDLNSLATIIEGMLLEYTVSDTSGDSVETTSPEVESVEGYYKSTGIKLEQDSLEIASPVSAEGYYQSTEIELEQDEENSVETASPVSESVEGYYQSTGIKLEQDEESVFNIRKEIDEVTDPAAVALAYEQAVKQGVNEANQFKIVTLGAEGAGKTSTIRSLLDLEFQQDQPSTVGADTHTVDICNTFTADRIFVCNWKTKEFQHHLNDLSIRHKHEIKETMTKTLTTEPLKAKTPDSKKIESTRLNEQQSKGKEYDKVSRSAGLEVLKSKVTPDGKIRIVIYDLGGQEVYYEVHYLFLVSYDVVFLTFNASVSLDEPVVRRYQYTIFQKEYKTEETRTTYKVIEATLHTIYSHCGIDGGNFSRRNPTVIMIATHSCNLTEDEKRAITNTLFSRLPPKLRDHFPVNNKDAIHFIDNKERNSEAFNHLRAVAVKAAEHTLTEERPITYLKFEENILIKSQNRTELSKENALHIAKEAGLDPTDKALQALLQYYTVRGILLYYPDIEALKNTVFISPQNVSNLVTSVIKTHDYFNEKCASELSDACVRFDKFGLLEEKLLDDMLEIFGYSKDIVLALLEKFELAIEIDSEIKFENEDASYVTPNKGRVFFVPSMLVHNKIQDYLPPQDSISNIILYHFPNKFIPVAVFNRVLILVIKWCKVKGHRIRCVFNGVGVFDFSDNNKQSFKLKHCSRTSSIKCHIWVRKQELNNKQLWQQRIDLLELMQAFINIAHYHCIPKASKPTAYVECPLHHDEEYDPHIRLDAIKAKALCTKVNEYIPEGTYKLLLEPINQCVTNVSAPRQLVRGAVCIDQIEDKNETPEIKDLHRYVICLCAADWRDVGLELNLKKTTLDTILKDNPLDCKACFKSTLAIWLQSNPDATWRMLEVAITNVRRAQNGLGPVTDIYGPC